MSMTIEQRIDFARNRRAERERTRLFMQLDKARERRRRIMDQTEELTFDRSFLPASLMAVEEHIINIEQQIRQLD